MTATEPEGDRGTVIPSPGCGFDFHTNVHFVFYFFEFGSGLASCTDQAPTPQAFPLILLTRSKS